MKNILLPLFIILSAIVNIQAQFISKANYALAEKFRNIGLGSLFAQNSMTIYPRFINGTDKFWFDFRSSQGTSHYFVDPEKRLKEPLFNMEIVNARLSEDSRQVVNMKNFIHLSCNSPKISKKLPFHIKNTTMNTTVPPRLSAGYQKKTVKIQIPKKAKSCIPI